ncbi:hypothetical protein Trydic_g16696 [Trypoxylus dichotomus]
MYERNRRKFGRGNTHPNRAKRSRGKSPPRHRSPIRISRDHSRPRFERNHSPERFLRRSRDRPESKFERISAERFEPPHKIIDDPGRFEPPPREVIDHPRSFENERYIPPSPRFEERAEVVEPVAVERNLSFECPADYVKFPGDGRFFEAPPASNVEPVIRPLENTSNFTPHQKEENNDKPDPWSNAPSSSTSQLQPTFGQEKGSNLIPEFDPESSDLSVNAFLRLVDKVGQEKDWSSNDRKFQFSMKLRGNAKDWFINGNKFLESWSSIKKQFRTSFPDDMDYHSNLTNMLERTKEPDEDLSSYFNYKIVLLRNCNITGRKAVSCLIGGLPDTAGKLKTNALDKNFATPEELYKFLMDENIEEMESPGNNRKCNTCGKRGHCDCSKNEGKLLLHGESLRNKGSVKCYKDIYVSGNKLKCFCDEDFPHNTIRESDVDFLKLRYRRQVTTINGYDRITIAALGQIQMMVRVDNLLTEMSFYVVRDNIQETPVVLGKAALKYPHSINRNVVFFTAEENFEERAERDRMTVELRRSGTPLRRNHDEFILHRSSPDHIARSPRRSPPGRLYKEPMFLNQFYGNPYA